MMRFIPNTFTVGNLFCGFLALHYVFQGNYVPAAWLIVVGAVLDKMDGRLARRIGSDSQFGIQFDSIVDVCTFGIVPATLIYQAHLQTPWGLGLAFVKRIVEEYHRGQISVVQSAPGTGTTFEIILPV